MNIVICILGLFYLYYTFKFALYFSKEWKKYFDKRQKNIHQVMIWLIPFLWIGILKILMKTDILDPFVEKDYSYDSNTPGSTTAFTGGGAGSGFGGGGGFGGFGGGSFGGGGAGGSW